MIDEKIIPSKSIFKPEEVCELLSIKPYILRFWETEFVEIAPIVSSSGKKLFEKKDILLLSVIKELLFDKKLTLEKAKHEMTKVDLDDLMSKSNDESFRASEPKSSSDVNTESDLEEKEKQLLPETQIDPKHLKEIKSLLFEISSKSALIKQTYHWV
ncbi:MAG: hypothetical protein CME61_00920 [Halobacteriovoraceae bacterium]|nr:hypothetical protein [Halobacteriovoraceae bacterium]|tara:strand:+ start:315 stop:785 length:471 start_codon:yes stop_codon:yes gene_type:complete